MNKFEILNLKGCQIIPCGFKHATHTVYSVISGINILTEEFCKSLCTENDAGKQHLNSSRFTYTSKLVKEGESIPMLALACVQSSIKRFYGDGVSYVNITLNKNNYKPMQNE